ncbi:hypothetical protein L484_016140 [Morus notabilis]|uniref:Uncharacterized protein n=1 Tax=Morus notabilis TaxID=981085 RepID=W9QBK3_9ROSA|nr:hypothetical protein L484_016140 [Morus notabilis]
MMTTTLLKIAAASKDAKPSNLSLDSKASINNFVFNPMIVPTSAGTLDGPPEKPEFLSEPEPEPPEKFGPPARARISP